MRSNALHLAMNKRYIVYYWSSVRKMYIPIRSFYFLSIAKEFSSAIMAVIGFSCIVVPYCSHCNL